MIIQTFCLQKVGVLIFCFLSAENPLTGLDRIQKERIKLNIIANGKPVKISGLLITQIDYAASTALTQREGHCPAASHGLHSVKKGETHCSKCGAR